MVLYFDLQPVKKQNFKIEFLKVDSETGFKKCYGLGMVPMDVASQSTATLIIDFANGVFT
jgi:hypothetical protein